MGSVVLAVGVCWSAGIALGAQAGLSVPVLTMAAVAALAALALARAPVGRLIALGLLALLLGQLRLVLESGVDQFDPLAAHAGPVVVTGRFLDAPIPRGSRVEAVVELDGIVDGESVAAPVPLGDARPRVLVRAPALRASYGDRIEARGRLARPRSRPGWPLVEILARRGVHWVLDTGGARVLEPGSTSLARTLAGLRGLFEANTRAVVPEPHASLVAGIVFGARVGLPPDLKTAMSATGTSHLTAVSGANVAMVAGALLVLSTRLLGRTSAALVAMAGVWLYTVMVGAPPSALRAATMATFALAAFGLGRQPDAIVGLIVAVAVLLGWDPGLAADLGFQLSVAATAGLVLLMPTFERWLAWLPRAVRGHVAMAVAAQVATLPIVIGTFQRISLVSLPANVLAAPTIPPLMALGVSLAVLGILPGFDVVLGWTAWAVAGLLLAVIHGAASLPGGVVAVGKAPGWLPWLWYVGLACWVAAESADVKALGVKPGALRAVALACPLGFVVWLLVGWAGGGRSTAVEVALLDIEPAAAFIRTPSGRSVLVTAGAPGPGLTASVGGLLDLTESAVDVAIGPGGLRTGLDLLALTADAPDDRSAPGVVGDTVEPGTRIELGDGVTVQVVDVRASGQATVIDLAILTNGLAVLLPGSGVPSERWADLEPDAVTVGRLPSSAVAWARMLPPRRWLLLIGEPVQERARGQSGVPFLTRREHGQIDLSVDGDAVSVQSERCPDGEACQVQLPVPIVTSLER
jgi:competence protein ComEC